MNEDLFIGELTITTEGKARPFSLAQITAIIGPNGAGKTRLLAAIKHAAERLSPKEVDGFSTSVEVIPAKATKRMIDNLAREIGFEPTRGHYYWNGQWLTNGERSGETKEAVAERLANSASFWVSSRIHMSGHYDRIR